jgi:hypothetical protein
MRHATFAAALLLAACTDRSANTQVSANDPQPNEPQPVSALPNPENQLTPNANGTRTLHLEGNDSATFVGGNLVEINRAP